MGPTVWELDGPMPTFNRSKTLSARRFLPRWVAYGAKRCVKSNIEQGVGLSSGCLDKGLGPPSN